MGVLWTFEAMYLFKYGHIRILYHVLISKGSCTYVTWCVTRSWCWRCECVCGSQGLARCAPAGSAWRCPAVLPRAWLCSLWDRGRLSQALTWSWWAAATACHWWRRGLPQVGARPTFCPSKAARLRIVSSVEYLIRWLLGCSLDVAFWSNSKICFYDIASLPPALLSLWLCLSILVSP